VQRVTLLVHTVEKERVLVREVSAKKKSRELLVLEGEVEDTLLLRFGGRHPIPLLLLI
jgi:hypothetical protein